jgi:hypothetical protein
VRPGRGLADMCATRHHHAAGNHRVDFIANRMATFRDHVHQDDRGVLVIAVYYVT